VTTTQGGPTPAKMSSPPDHSAEAQGSPHATTGDAGQAGPLGSPQALPGNGVQTSGICWENEPLIYTPKDLCSRLHISLNTCYSELRHGSLAALAVRCGKQYRVGREAFRRYIEGERVS